MLDEIIRRIEEAMDAANEAYKANRSIYDAGRYNGLQEALEIISKNNA